MSLFVGKIGNVPSLREKFVAFFDLIRAFPRVIMGMLIGSAPLGPFIPYENPQKKKNKP